MKLKALFSFLFCLSFPAINALEPSGSLPILNITTENYQPILDKENYIKASYTLDPNKDSSLEPQEGTLQIRGRGNYTWDCFEKKPYRLKLDEKTPLLGFKKSKHFVLLAHADDNLGFMREPMGFKMSELAGLPWTPGQKPVEVIINGDYRGLYFLVENIRIDKDRVNIFDQEDEDPSTDVTGGWLCELDNYEEDPSEQITITESNGNIIRITHHSPEIINQDQENFLRTQMEAIDKAFYIQDPESKEYEELVDVESLVSYYVLQELMDGQESFHGSCYLHRDRGADQKWIWGPVWDFGNTFLRSEGKMIYEWPDWGQTWIDQIVKFNSFQEKYKNRFQDFMEYEYEDIKTYIREYSSTLKEAAVADAKRWPNYGNKNITERAEDLLLNLKHRITFLSYKWGIEANISSGLFLRGDFNDWSVDWSREFDIPENGVYYFDGENFTGRFKIADYGWSPNNWGTRIVNQEIPLDTPIEIINGPDSKDMVSPGGFKSIILRIIEPGKKATIELSTVNAGVNEIVSPSKSLNLQITGRTISSKENLFSVYNINGLNIATNVRSVDLNPGVYIVKGASETHKIVIR